MSVHSRPPGEFRAFYQDVYDDVLRFAQRRTESAERAEDAVADALLVAWRRFADAPAAHGDRRAWLFGIVRNTLLNAGRSHARQAAVAVRVQNAGDVMGRDHADDSGRRIDLVRAWRSLGAEHQEVLALTVFEQLNSRQAAVVLGISSVAYRARLSRARRLLRAHLDEPASPAGIPFSTEARR